MKIILFNKNTFAPLLAFNVSNQMNDDMAAGLMPSQMRVHVLQPLSVITTSEYTVDLDQAVRAVTITFVLMRHIDYGTVHNGHLAFIADDEAVRLSRQDLFSLKRELTAACGGHSQPSDDYDFSIFG